MLKQIFSQGICDIIIKFLTKLIYETQSQTQRWIKMRSSAQRGGKRMEIWAFIKKTISVIKAEIIGHVLVWRQLSLS